MNVSRIRPLRGPNLWTRHTAIEALVRCEGDQNDLSALSQFEQRLRNLFPGMGNLRPNERGAKMSLANDKTELMRAINKANKIAIAKPELAPYGKAAIEYLKAEGLWDIAKDKLIYGDNIGIATMYVVTGAADLGFTALSLAKSAEVAKEAHFILVNSKLYEPIKQRMVLIKDAPQEAITLYQFMQRPAAKSILQKYGYSTP